jgi:hypothetical protein
MRKDTVADEEEDDDEDDVVAVADSRALAGE